MLCERCKHNQATVQYTYTVNGSGVSYSLCGQCYHQLSGAKAPLFSDFLFSDGINMPPKMQDKVKKCDLCGYTVHQIHKEGKVGCARCYRTFQQELSGMIARIHGNKLHVSDAPKAEKASTLEQLLEKAIREENYEEAAVLRDRIKAEREGKL